MKKVNWKKTCLLSGIALVFLSLASIGFSAVNLTAGVDNSAPVVNDIQACDGSCGYGKSIDPGTALTFRVSVTDDNNNMDWDTAQLEFYTSSDSNDDSGADWDHIVLTAPLTFASGNGCTITEGGSTDVNCITVTADDWTTKFVNGDANVFFRIQDIDGASDANSGLVMAVNSVTGFSQDAGTGSWSSLIADSTNNAISADSNAYIHTVHTGNSNQDLACTATNLTDVDTISVDNLHWDLAGTPAGADFTGGSDTIQAAWGRGTDPTPASLGHYIWLDVPLGIASGSYTGTLTYGAS